MIKFGIICGVLLAICGFVFSNRAIENLNFEGMFILGIVTVVGIVIVIVCLNINNYEQQQETQEVYYEKVTDQKYTVYCDGEKLEFPDKIDLDNFDIKEIDDSKQEIILTRE